MCQGLLSSSRHFEKREDPGDEVGGGGRGGGQSRKSKVRSENFALQEIDI